MNKSEPVGVGIRALQPPPYSPSAGFFLEIEMDTKWCHNCKTEKPISEFSKSRSTNDGLHAQCKVCNAAYRVSHRPEHAADIRASKLLYPMRNKARYTTSNAIRDGRLTRPNHCENPECNIECKPEAHHHKGYEPEHWLDVVFLCIECHKIADKKIGEGSNNGYAG